MRQVVWLEALRGGRRGPAWAGPAVLATAVLLFVAVGLLRLAVEQPETAILVLLGLPVTLLAFSFGRVAGLAGAAVAVALVFGYAATGEGVVGGAAGLLTRTTLLVLLGYMTGWFADRLLASIEAEDRTRLAFERAYGDLQEAQRLAGVGSWSWEPDTDRLSWSSEMYRLFAVDPEAEPLTTRADLRRRRGPAEVAPWAEACDEALLTHQAFEVPQRLERPDGSSRQVVWRGEVLVEDDRVVALRGTTQDVTAVREAQLAAQAAAERLSGVLEHLPDSVTVATAVRDADGHVVDFTVDYANPAAGRVLGLAPEDMVGHRWSELWPNRTASPVFAAFARTVENGEPLVLPCVRNADYRPGTAEVLDLRVAQLGDGCVTIARDVTERARSDRALARAAAQFTATFDHAPVGMALIRPDGVLLRANQALGAMTGRQRTELVGAPFDELVDARDAEHCQAQLTELFASRPGATCRGELRLRTIEGAARWTALRMSLIEDEASVYAVAHVEDVHERKRYEGQMRHLADHDALTGLYNRRRFHEELAHHHALHTRYGGGGAVVLIDLDNFKDINDTLGHRTGDELLQAISRMLRSRLRDSDVVARLGGDEFAVLLPGVDQSRAVEVATSLLAGIRAAEVSEAGQRVRSTGSAGVALLDEPSAVGADDVLANADLAMYAAKEAGRDVLVVYDPRGPHAARSQARFRWLDRIRLALENDLFVLRAQPIQDLATGEITGCELLVRMSDGARLVQPDRFLDIAERHGLAVAIDRVVVARGIDLAASQQRSPEFRWEINLSGDSLGDPTLLALIEAKLHETGLRPGSLVFEITETAAISNMDVARVFAAQVGELGCGFALDDFGAGYGSFYYLKHLPFDYLKIDGEFIRDLARSEVDRVIVRSIVASAHPLGKQTIAEYVGDAETFDLLRELGVDHAQGYYIGRPVEATLPLSAPVGSAAGMPSRPPRAGA